MTRWCGLIRYLSKRRVVDQTVRRDAQLIVELWRKHWLIVVIAHHVFPLLLILLDSTDLGLDRVASILDGAGCVVSDSQGVIAICIVHLVLHFEPVLHHLHIIIRQLGSLRLRWTILHFHTQRGLRHVALKVVDFDFIRWFTIVVSCPSVGSGTFCSTFAISS